MRRFGAMVDGMNRQDAVASRDGKPLTGRTVFFWLLGFFGVVIAANGVMTKLAIDTLPGTEVDSAYRASLAYNSSIKAAQQQDARGWRANAHVERDAAGRATLVLELRDKTGALLAGLGVNARLARPADKRGDRLIAMREPQAGLYRGEADDVPPGQWDLVIEAERGDERVFASRNRLVLD